MSSPYTRGLIVFILPVGPYPDVVVPTLTLLAAFAFGTFSFVFAAFLCKMFLARGVWRWGGGKCQTTSILGYGVVEGNTNEHP